METNLQIFFHDRFGELRTVEKDGRPWIVAVDVCRILEIKNPRDALKRLDDDEKGVALIYTLGGEQKMNIVNEYGFYRLVLASRKKSKDIQEFQRWVYHEVIPNSVREKLGEITSVEENMPAGNPEFPPEFSKLWANVKTGEVLVEAAKRTTDKKFREEIVREAVRILTDGKLTPALENNNSDTATICI